MTAEELAAVAAAVAVLWPTPSAAEGVGGDAVEGRSEPGATAWRFAGRWWAGPRQAKSGWATST